MTVTSGASSRLTPDEVQAVTFPAARLGRRGLDEEHVRAFCQQVEGELVRLLNEKAALDEEVQRLRRRVLGITGEEDSAGYRREDAHLQAVRILSKAQQTADNYVADAQDYSRQLAQDARRRRDEILAEARSHAALMLEEAHGQASQAAAAAMSESAAQPLANRGEADRGEADRSELEGELAYLRTFCHIYRTHLRAYLEALQRNVDEWERTEKSSIAAARAELPIPRQLR
jgi:DivIVA domain-containing protein